MSSYNTRGSTNQDASVAPRDQPTLQQGKFIYIKINLFMFMEFVSKTEIEITCNFSKSKKLIFQYHLNQYQL